MFNSVHKRHPDAGAVRSKAVNHGQNSEVTTLDDSKYVRCHWCGFVCHLDRDMRASGKMGDGVGSGSYIFEIAPGRVVTENEIDRVISEVGDFVITEDITYYRDDPEVKSGCAMCGAYTYG